MNQIMNGWFSEIGELWPSRALSVEIDATLYSQRSAYQQIDMYQTKTLGKMLVLDGIIQFTEDDEFVYQEMMSHVALFAHPKPKHVLVIGGGDGGVLREIARHAIVEVIDICEIDEDVINVCKRFAPSMACGFDDPRVNLHVADGSKFSADRQGHYDVIIVDSTDPIGPGRALFERPFYTAMQQALNPAGILAIQAESIFLHEEIIVDVLSTINQLFPIWGYASMMIPTYPSGTIGVCLASTETAVIRPARLPDTELQNQLRYYTPSIHESSFKLPAFAARIIDGVRN